MPEKFKPEQTPKLEKKAREGNIKLNLDFNFISDDKIREYYDRELHEIADKNNWIKNNQHILQNKEYIAEGVKKGFLPDNSDESVWRFFYNKTKDGSDEVIQLKQKLQGKTEDIIKTAEERLGKFLPDWSLTNANLNLGLNKKGVWHVNINTNIVTGDLGIIRMNKNFIEAFVKGTTHEIFHIWMSEKIKAKVDKGEMHNCFNNNMSDLTGSELHDQLVFTTANEGLAALISGGPEYKDFTERQGKDYEQTTKEAFKQFNDFAKTKSRDKICTFMEGEKQLNFYIVGYEISKILLEKLGLDKFKLLIDKTRDNPMLFIKTYQKISHNNPKLPQIEI